MKWLFFMRTQYSILWMSKTRSEGFMKVFSCKISIFDMFGSGFSIFG